MGNLKAFLLIAVMAAGLLMYNQNSKVVSNTSSQIDNMAIEAHNSMFIGYSEGQMVKGSQVRDLALKIMGYNKNVDSEYIVDCNVDSLNLSSIKNSDMYEITDITYTNGIITSILFAL